MGNPKEMPSIIFLIVIILIVSTVVFNSKPNDKVNSIYTNTNNYSSSSNVSSSNNISNSTTNPGNKTSSSSYGIGREFKQAMDSYEAFMDKYIEIVVKYNNSKGNDTQILKDYGDYMKKYIDATSAFEKWGNKDLNKEEAKYYVEVQTRVNQKLINASIDLSYQ